MADDCIFCSIIKGDIPSTRVDEDDHTIAFMDIHPWTPGHALVIPKKHTPNLYEIEPDELAAVAHAAKRLALRMRDSLDCGGINLMNATNAVAWQTVFHFHMHVIPRYEGDPLQLPWIPEPGDMDKIRATGELLKEHYS